MIAFFLALLVGTSALPATTTPRRVPQFLDICVESDQCCLFEFAYWQTRQSPGVYVRSDHGEKISRKEGTFDCMDSRDEAQIPQTEFSQRGPYGLTCREPMESAQQLAESSQGVFDRVKIVCVHASSPSHDEQKTEVKAGTTDCVNIQADNEKKESIRAWGSDSGSRTSRTRRTDFGNIRFDISGRGTPSVEATGGLLLSKPIPKEVLRVCATSSPGSANMILHAALISS